MSQIPTKSQILQWITDNPKLTSKRDISKAFGIKGADRIELKRLLKELEAEGHLEKRKRKTYRDPDKLPPVSVLQVQDPTPDGDLFARPLEWHGEGAEPVVLMVPAQFRSGTGCGRPHSWQTDRGKGRGAPVRGAPDPPHRHQPAQRILGVFRKGAEGGRIVPIDKGQDKEWLVPEGATGGAKDGELVEAEQSGPRGRHGPAACAHCRRGWAIPARRAPCR